MSAPTLTTDRLSLRSFEPEDVETFAQVLADREAMRGLWSIPGTPEDLLEHAGMYVNGSIESWQCSGYGFWAVCTGSPELSKSEQIIGFTGFVFAGRASIDPSEGLETGWGFRPDFQGHGLATEATRAIVDFAFEVLDTPKLIATTNAKNQPSRRLMERLGFSYAESIAAYEKTSVLYTLSRGSWGEER